MRLIKLFVVVSLLVFVSACALDSVYGGGIFASGPKVSQKHKGHGPPPHAPAHGYRHKSHHGVDLEFDTGLGVYVAIELPGTYFFDGLYFRWSEGVWEAASHFQGPWRVAKQKEVPPGLRKSKAKKHPGKGSGKGKGKY